MVIQMTVYVDVVIGLNFTINFLILSCVKWISGAETRRAGLVSASLAGGIYAVFMFDSRFAVMYSPAAKIIMSVLIVSGCFQIKKNFLKLLFYFYITAFAFSGAAAFVSNLSGVLKMENGIFYTKNSVWVIIAGCIIACFIIRYVLKHMRMSKKRYGEKTEITVSVEGKSVNIKGMIDTGNSLLDPITLYPVVVVEYDCIKSILPEEISEFLKEGNDLNCNINRRYLSKIRLIPYNSVGANDILKGFRPDYIKINGTEKEIREVIVAVIYDKLSENNEFDAILNPLI